MAGVCQIDRLSAIRSRAVAVPKFNLPDQTLEIGHFLHQKSNLFTQHGLGQLRDCRLPSLNLAPFYRRPKQPRTKQAGAHSGDRLINDRKQMFVLRSHSSRFDDLEISERDRIEDHKIVRFEIIDLA